MSGKMAIPVVGVCGFILTTQYFTTAGVYYDEYDSTATEYVGARK